MTVNSAGPWRVDGGGVTILVRLTPKGGRDAIDGVEELADGRQVLKVRVASPPIAGEANKALLGLVSNAVGVSRSRIRFEAGASSRLKILHVVGDGQTIINTLEKLVSRSA